MSTTIVIGDSLGVPRPWHDVGLHQTYAAHLQNLLGAGHYVVNWSQPENTSRRAASDGFVRTYVDRCGADSAVIQLGIVDCAPRLMGNIERVIGGIFNRLPLLRPLYLSYVRLKSRHRYRLTRWFPRTLVEKDAYVTHMSALYDRLSANGVKRILVINIAAPGAYLLKRSYGIAANVEAYNAELDNIAAARADVQIIDLWSATQQRPDWVTADDGHHILAPAHDWIANELHRVIAAADAG